MSDRRNPSLTLDPTFTHLVTCGEVMVLVGEDDYLLFEEPLARDVVRLVDGRRSAVDIALAAAGSHPPEMVHYVLIVLEEQGIVRPVVDASVPARRPGPGTRAGAVDGSLSQGACEQPAGVPGSVTRLRDAWESGGSGPGLATLSVGAESEALQLILCRDYLDPRLAGLVRRSAQISPVLVARVGTRSAWLGPLLRAGASPCFSCLRHRLRLNLVARAFLHAQRDSAEPKGPVEALRSDVPGAAFQRLADCLDQVAFGDLEGVLRELPLDGSPDVDHAVARLPQCESCGDPRLAPPGPDLRLTSRKKMAGSGGGFRTVDPSETLRRVGPLVDPLTGVVRSIRRVPVEGCDLIHVYSANHAQHYGDPTLTELREEVRDHSGGKGWTDLDARVSAVCESLERSSSVHRGGEAARVARMSELGADALAPNDLMHFSQEQYGTRTEWNERHEGGFQRIPEPYADEAIEWSEVRSLVSDAVRWVPTAFIYYGHAGAAGRFCDGDSNGLAGGNCVEEAVLQGLLELVERDAVAIWWYNRLERPAVDIRTLDDRWSAGILDHYGRLGRELWALELTTDLGVPVYAALSAERGREIVFGFGAHVEPRIALRRALMEVNQMLTAVVLGPRERKAHLGADFPDALAWWKEHTLQTDPYLRGAANLQARPLHEARLPSSDDLKDDITVCVDRVASVGCDVLVHDLTRPDIAFPVVKVIVPGLRHFWRRLGPGRLYDVPVGLGWRRAPLPEDGMNPVSLFV